MLLKKKASPPSFLFLFHIFCFYCNGHKTYKKSLSPFFFFTVFLWEEKRQLFSVEKPLFKETKSRAKLLMNLNNYQGKTRTKNGRGSTKHQKSLWKRGQLDAAELRNRFPSRNHLSWSSSYDGQKEQRIFPRLWLSTLPDYFPKTLDYKPKKRVKTGTYMLSK